MKMLLLLISTLVSARAFAASGCENFASMYAIQAVANELILEGTAIYDNNIYPDTPQFQKSVVSNGSNIEEYTSVITVVTKADNTMATRYYVTLSVIDQDASCSLVSGSSTIELEN